MKELMNHMIKNKMNSKKKIMVKIKKSKKIKILIKMKKKIYMKLFMKQQYMIKKENFYVGKNNDMIKILDLIIYVFLILIYHNILIKSL